MLDFNRLSETPNWLVEKLISPRPATTNASRRSFMSKGQRNNDLTSLAGFLRNKGLSEEEIFETLQGVNLTRPDPVSIDEVAAVARSVARYQPGGAKGDMYDVPLSRRVAEAISDCCRYVPQSGWKVYDGCSWVQDVNGVLAKEQIKRQCEALSKEATASGDPDRTRVAPAFLSNAKINAIMALVPSDPSVRADIADFDNRSGVLNVLNGTLDLSTGELMPHEPANLLTRLANVEYDPSAVCPYFDSVLDEALPPAHQAFLLRYLGYALLGDPKEQMFAILHGAGANGKSTLINAVSHLLGTYTANVEPATLIKQKGDRIRTDIARLRGVHLAVTSELAMGEILDAPLVKRFTGRDMITARVLYGAEFEFRPRFSLVMTTNALPVIDGGDRALARRLILLSFGNVVPEDRRDSTLGHKLESEASGILNRLLQGLREYRESGLKVPDDIKAAVGEYVDSSDMLRSFLKDATEQMTGETVGANALRIQYQTWCSCNGIRPLSGPLFKQELVKKGFVTKRLKSGNVWMDLRLRRPNFH